MSNHEETAKRLRNGLMCTHAQVKAVAAALAQAEAERERGCGCKTSEQTGTLNGFMCEWHREKYLQVCTDRDAAEAKGVRAGLERARAEITASEGDLDFAVFRIDAEIAKAEEKI